MDNKKLRTALFLHIVLVVLEMIDTNHAYAKDGLGMLIYYTEDSNLLCLIVSALFTLVMLPIIFKGQTNGFVSTFLMRNYRKDGEEKVTIPTLLLVLRYVTSCCLLVTFLVVIFVLGPTDGYREMLLDGTHLSCRSTSSSASRPNRGRSSRSGNRSAPLRRRSLTRFRC